MEIMLSPPNAILFILDLANNSIVVPEYEAGVLTASNESCISVCTRAEVDGEVTVILSQRGAMVEEPGRTEVFRGSLKTPSGVVSVVTSELEKVAEISCDDGETTMVSIGTDDSEHPGVIWIGVG